MFKRILNKGITPGLSFTEQKKVKLVNGICLFAFSIQAILLVVFIITGFLQGLILEAINISFFTSILILNSKQKFNAGRFILCLYFPLFLSFPALSTPNQGSASDMCIVSFSLISIFLFDKWKIIIPLFLYCMLLFMAVKILQRMEIFIPIGNLHNLTPIYFFEISIGFAAAFIFTNMFKSEHERYENAIIEKSNELEESKKLIELKNEDIVSSINYAKRIQGAVLPNEEKISRGIPLSFILYKPKDIVSGDFFWFHEIDTNSYIIVAVDCTGHGVPGAFMTVIGTNLLNQVVAENKITKPSDILSEIDKRITITLKQEKQHHQLVQDGMDLALLKVDKEKKEFVFTSAKRPAIFIRDGVIQEFKGSKNTLGGLRSDEKQFNEIKMNFREDDVIYLFSDGYIDQFGGTNNKKFMIKKFRELLLGIHQLPMHEQKKKLENGIQNWVGNNEQTDDMLVIGIRF